MVWGLRSLSKGKVGDGWVREREAPFLLTPAPKTFFFPFHPSWPGPTSSVRPFSTALKLPSDPPPLQRRGAASAWGALPFTLRTELIFTALLLCFGAHQNHRERLLKHNAPPSEFHA